MTQIHLANALTDERGLRLLLNFKKHGVGEAANLRRVHPGGALRRGEAFISQGEMLDRVSA